MDSLKAQFTSGVRNKMAKDGLKDGALTKEPPPTAPKPCCEERKKVRQTRPNTLSSKDIMYATEHPEFYYKDTDEVVMAGDPIGFDMDVGDEVELVLFYNIYWNPEY